MTLSVDRCSPPLRRPHSHSRLANSAKSFTPILECTSFNAQDSTRCCVEWIVCLCVCVCVCVCVQCVRGAQGMGALVDRAPCNQHVMKYASPKTAQRRPRRMNIQLWGILSSCARVCIVEELPRQRLEEQTRARVATLCASSHPTYIRVFFVYACSNSDIL